MTPPSPRIASLDQFRGYTVAGMLVVNFLGGYAVVPAVLRHHHTFCSYADTIMPQFFLAVGFAYRLTWLRRAERDGRGATYRHAIGRSLGLILLGLVVYHLDGSFKTWGDLAARPPLDVLAAAFQRDPFQALVHIGVTSLWILPVIGAGPRARLAFLVASAALHVGASALGYLDFARDRPVIDGGPLGFLTWTIPTLAGAWAYDAHRRHGPRGAIPRYLVAAALLMAIGYGMSRLGTHHSPPFLKPDFTAKQVDLWTMSQRTGGVTYLAFAAGFGLLVLAGFVAACDLGPWRVGLFRTFGSNALAAYLVHMMVNDAVQPFVPRDSPAGWVALGLAASLGLSYLFVRALERRGIYLAL